MWCQKPPGVENPLQREEPYPIVRWVRAFETGEVQRMREDGATFPEIPGPSACRTRPSRKNCDRPAAERLSVEGSSDTRQALRNFIFERSRMREAEWQFKHRCGWTETFIEPHSCMRRLREARHQGSGKRAKRSMKWLPIRPTAAVGKFARHCQGVVRRNPRARNAGRHFKDIVQVIKRECGVEFTTIRRGQELPHIDKEWENSRAIARCRAPATTQGLQAN